MSKRNIFDDLPFDILMQMKHGHFQCLWEILEEPLDDIIARRISLLKEQRRLDNDNPSIAEKATNLEGPETSNKTSKRKLSDGDILFRFPPTGPVY